MDEMTAQYSTTPTLQSPNHIKLIACDIDGTLICDGRIVSPELKDMFAELSKRGVWATLCTGRMPHRTIGVADRLGLSEYLICTEGGHVFHRPTGDTIHYSSIDGMVVEEVARLVEAEAGIELTAISGDVLWATHDEAGRHAHWWGDRYELVRDVRDVARPVLIMLFGEHCALTRACAVLRERLSAEKALIHDVEDKGGYGHFKIGDPGTDKGVGAEKVVQRLGGDRSQVLAFGDYLNDLGIMRHVGYSICPANAHPMVRATASYVSPYSAAQGFVAREIARIFGFA